MGGGVGCPPRGDAAARCHFNHNPLAQEHKGRRAQPSTIYGRHATAGAPPVLTALAIRLSRRPGALATGGALARVGARGRAWSPGETENYMARGV